MQINFYPESDKEEFIKAADVYREIWEKEGEKIVSVIEKISGLKFKTKIINAVTFEGMSYSTPLRLRSSQGFENKKGTLIHELCHRLFEDNSIKIKQTNNREEKTFEIHKILDLILYDVWVEFYGKGYAKKQIDKEISYGYPPYEKAWDYALSLTKEERIKEFKKLCGPTGN